ncbi:MAG: helix-turn-helix domain-containing protein [Ktedonobacteraceae bacterium]|nr:helix-turn-helix domain-containing protein [Ktedonobacteraceae bacterium]
MVRPHPNIELTHARRRRAWSQEEVAGKIGTTQANLSRWERGITSPTPYYLRLLCKLFDTSPQDLFPHMFEQETALSVSPEEREVSTDALLSLEQASTVFMCNMGLDRAEEFYGREREKLRLLIRTLKGESTSVIGPRRIGKTWLLQYLRLVTPTQLGPRYTVGYLDATGPSCATRSGFTREILNVLSLDIPEQDTMAVSKNLTTLEISVKEAHADGRILVLCIDEFEGLCKQADFHLDILENLRAIAQVGLGLVIASKKPLIEIVSEVVGNESKTSPFFNIFVQISLKPFTHTEASKFVAAKSQEAVFNEQEQEALLNYGRVKDQEQWLPWRLQLVGTLLQEDKLLADQGNLDSYRPTDPDYWQEFEERVEEAYRGVAP